MGVTPKEYAKNILKSAKYIGIESIRGINPDLTDFVDSTKENIESATEWVGGLPGKFANRRRRSIKDIFSAGVNKVLGEKNVEHLKTGFRYGLDDIKTGKLYNEEREDANMDAMFGFSDDGEEESGSEEQQSKSTIKTIGDKIAYTQAACTADMTAKIGANINRSSVSIMIHNEQLAKGTTASLMAINASILSFHNDFAAPLNAHIANSSSFYTTATTELAKQTSHLEKISKILTDRFEPKPSSIKEAKENAWGKFVGSSGIPNVVSFVSEKLKDAKENTSTFKNMFVSFQNMLGMLLGNTANNSPVATILSDALSGFLQKTRFGKGLTETSEILRNGIIKSLARIHTYKKESKGMLSSMIAGMFDITPDITKEAKFENYEKGRVDWTGKDSKALREVIPTQLSAILAAITGREAKVFDYNKGKFVTATAAYRGFTEERIQQISSRNTDYRNSILNEVIEEDRDKVRKLHEQGKTDVRAYDMDSRHIRSISRDFDTLMYLFSFNNIDLGSIESKQDFISICNKLTGSNNNIVDKNNINIIAKSIFKRNTAIGGFINAANVGRITNSEILSNAKDTLGSYGTVANGSDVANAHLRGKGGIVGVIDNKGNDIFFYLQDYYKQLRLIATNVSNQAGSRKKNRKKGSSKITSDDIEIPINNQSLINKNRENIGISSESSIERKANLNPTAEDPEGRYVSTTGKYFSPVKVSTRFSRKKKEKDNIFTKGINEINTFIDEVVFGNAGDSFKAKIREEGGLFGLITSFPKRIYEGLLKGFNKLADYVGNKVREFRESSSGKSFFGSIKDTIKNGASDLYNFAKDKVSDTLEGLGISRGMGSYKGGEVKKSGMVSVSEGELILPAKYNPNYKGNLSDGMRKILEKRNYEQWSNKEKNKNVEYFGQYAKGGIVKPLLSAADKNEIRTLSASGMSPSDIAAAIGKPEDIIKDFITKESEKTETSAFGRIKNKASSIKNSVTKNILSRENKQEIRTLLASGMSTKDIAAKLGKSVDEVKSYIEYANTHDNDDNLKDQIRESLKSFTGSAKTRINNAIDYIFGEGSAENTRSVGRAVKEVIKKSAPKVAASGTVGAVLGGALTGSGLGLLGGLTLGAGAYILKNSGEVSERLFGTFDERTGKWSGGMLPDKAVKFLKDKLPSVVKSGILGGFAGALHLLPGGSLGGLVLGAGLELVSTTDMYKDIMFGKPDINGERTGGIMGSIRLNVVNPLIAFVKDGMSKVGDFVKKNIFEPFKGLFQPLTDFVRGSLYKRLRKVADVAETTIKTGISRLGEKFNVVLTPTSKIAGKIGTSVINKGVSILKMPGVMANAVSKGLTKHNIKAGYSTLSAKARTMVKGAKPSAYNEWASREGTTENDIFEASIYMGAPNGAKKQLKEYKQNLADTIIASFANGGLNNPREVKQLRKLFNSKDVKDNNDFSRVIKFVAELDPSIMGDATKEKVLNRIKEVGELVSSIVAKISKFETSRQDWFREKVGISSKKEIEKFASKGARVQSRTDVDTILKGRKNILTTEIDQAKQKDNEAQTLKDQEKESPIDAKRNSILENIKSLLSGIADKIGVDEKDKKDSSKSTNSENTNKPQQKETPIREKIDLILGKKEEDLTEDDRKILNRYGIEYSKSESKKDKKKSSNDNKNNNRRSIRNIYNDNVDRSLIEEAALHRYGVVSKKSSKQTSYGHRADEDYGNNRGPIQIKDKAYYEQIAESYEGAFDKFIGRPVQNIKELSSDALDTLRLNLPGVFKDTAISAIIGTAMTGGSPLGLLGGLVVGSGTSIIKRSDKISDKLFGEYDEETKKYKGGLLPKGVSNFIKEKLPNATKAGLLGGVFGKSGIVPGGLLGGIVVGTGVELIQSTETFQTLMFGEEDANGERHGGIVGSLQTHVVDPIKDFTHDGLKKISKFFDDHFFNPFKDLFDTTREWIKGSVRKHIGGLFKGIKNFFKNRKKSDHSVGIKDRLKNLIGERVKNPNLKKYLGRAGAVADNFIKNSADTVQFLGEGYIDLTKIPGYIANKTNEKLTKHNIKKGYSTLTPEQRMLLSDENYAKSIGWNGPIENSKYTQWAATASNDEIIEASKILNGKNAFEEAKKNRNKDLQNDILEAITGGAKENPEEARAIRNLINRNPEVLENNDYSTLRKYLDTFDESKLSKESKEFIFGKITETAQKNRLDTLSDEDFDKKSKEFFNKIGIDKNDIEKFVRQNKFQSQIDAETILKGLRDETLTKDRDEKNSRERLKEQEKDSPIDAERNSILKNIQSDISKFSETPFAQKVSIALDTISRKLGINSSEEARTGLFDNTKKKNKQTVSKDVKSKTISEKILPTDSSEKKEKELSESDKDQIRTLISSGSTPSEIAAYLKKSIGSVKDFIESDNNDDKKDTKNVSKKILPSPEPIIDKDIFGSGNNKLINEENTPKNGDIRKRIDADGNNIEEEYRQGSWQINTSDPDTNEAIDRREEDREKRNDFYSMFIDGTVFDKLAKIIHPKSEEQEKENEEKEKKSLIQKAKDFFGNMFGKNSIIGQGFDFIKQHLPTIAGALTTGIVLNETAKENAGTGKDSGMFKGADPDQRTKEVNDMNIVQRLGLGMDAIENTLRNRDTTTYKEDDFVSEYMSSRLGKNIAKNAVMGFGPLGKASNFMIKNTIGRIPFIGDGYKLTAGLATKTGGLQGLGGRFAARVAENNAKLHNGKHTILAPIVDTGSKVAHKVGDVTNKIGAKISSGGANIFGKIANSKLGKTVAESSVGKGLAKYIPKLRELFMKIFNALCGYFGVEGSAKAISEASEDAAKALAKEAGERLGKLLSNASLILYIASIANAIIEGAQTAKAKTILGIIDEPTLGQRILAAGLNGLNEAIPGIGGLIPTEMLVSIVMTGLEYLGWPKEIGEELSKQRAKAKATIDQYNKENGTTYNVEEYIHNVQGEYTVQEKIVKTAKSIGESFVGIFKETFGMTEEKDAKAANDRSNKNLNKVNQNYQMLKDSTPQESVLPTKPGQYASIGVQNNPNGLPGQYAGRGSGIHTTQIGNTKPFAGSNIEKIGCGPAAATTVLKAYGDTSANINEAADYAESGGYVASGSEESKGTKASYFKDILGKRGIKTSYRKSKIEIDHAVNSGKPTILLGQDKKNKSKANSPFGPNPHYVVARGSDAKGNMIVDDPELKGTAVYKKKDVLNGTKLGVATGGSSGLQDFLNKWATTALGVVIGNNFAGKFGNILKSLFGVNSGNQGDPPPSPEELQGATTDKTSGLAYPGSNSTSSTTGTTERSYTSISGPHDPFEENNVDPRNLNEKDPFGNASVVPVDSVPKENDPYIKLYNTPYGPNIKGISPCRKGFPEDPMRDVLNNCVGWASGRFNQIYNMITGEKGFKYGFNVNAKDFIGQAEGFGLTINKDIPQAGAIMVWYHPTRAGHVAVVEQVISKDKVITSESGFGTSDIGGYHFKSIPRERGNGDWGIWKNDGYTFSGFIYNPAVEQLIESGKISNRVLPTDNSSAQSKVSPIPSTNTSNSVIAENPTMASPNMSDSERKQYIYNWLLSNGFNHVGAAGVMGCWQQESGNSPRIVEGCFDVRPYPGSEVVLSSPEALSKYTTDNLFTHYDNIEKRIDHDAYKVGDYYYPGIGLAQWTGPRSYGLMQYAKGKGQNARNLDTQLNFFKNAPTELPDHQDLIQRMNNAKTPEDAATMFLDGFEMSPGFAAKNPDEDDIRRGHARVIYDTYANTSSNSSNPDEGSSSNTGMGSSILTGDPDDKSVPSDYSITRKIPVDYNFTKTESDDSTTDSDSYYDKDNNSRKAKHRNEASGQGAFSTSTNRNKKAADSDSSMAQKIAGIAALLEQIVKNTSFNASIPSLVDIMKQAMGVMGKISQMNQGSDQSPMGVARKDAAKTIDNEINALQKKLEAIAQTP